MSPSMAFLQREELETMTTQGRNTDRMSRADSPGDGATVRAADPPRYRLWFWFIRLVLTGDETAFRWLIVLLFLLMVILLALVVTLLALALVTRDWAGLGALILGGSLAGAYAVLRRHVRELSATNEGMGRPN
jgi:hypothetical protein